MLRKGLIVLALLALLLATASPALADRPEKEREQAQSQVQEQIQQEVQEQVEGYKLPRAFQGVVVSVDEEDGDGEDVVGSIVVETAKWGELTVVVDENTLIKWPQGLGKRILGDEVDVTAFQEGDRVVVQLVNKATGEDDEQELVARAIHLVPGQVFVHYTGRISDLGDEELTVLRGGGESMDFAFVADSDGEADGTPVFWRKARVGTEDLEEGQLVTVVARACGEDVCDALSIVIHSMPKDKEADAEEEDADTEGAKGKSEAAKSKVKPNKPDKSGANDEGDADDDDGDEDELLMPQGKGKGLLKEKPNRAS